MKGDRTTGGYPDPSRLGQCRRIHPDGPSPRSRRPRVLTATASSPITRPSNTAGVRFAILEDRKFKSAPSEVITELIAPEGFEWPNPAQDGFSRSRSSSIPDYDCTQLDRPDLQLLGERAGELSWRAGRRHLKESGQIGAVLSQSPWAHVAMYSPTSADTDSNGWPQSASRNRALKAIGDAPGGSCSMATCTWERSGATGSMNLTMTVRSTYSLPSFSSRASRRNGSLSRRARNRESGAPENTGEFHDRFGNKVTMYGAGNGLNGYGLILFDTTKREIELQFHPMNEERKPIDVDVPGWPHTVKF